MALRHDLNTSFLIGEGILIFARQNLNPLATPPKAQRPNLQFFTSHSRSFIPRMRFGGVKAKLRRRGERYKSMCSLPRTWARLPGRDLGYGRCYNPETLFVLLLPVPIRIDMLLPFAPR